MVRTLLPLGPAASAALLAATVPRCAESLHPFIGQKREPAQNLRDLVKSRRLSAPPDLHDVEDTSHAPGGAAYPSSEFKLTKHSWIRNLFTRPVSRPFRKVPRHTRLGIEKLEDR